MEIKPITNNDDLWHPVMEYAKNCSWRAGPYLAKQMQNNGFADWERVFAVTEGSAIAGYCTLAKTDCIPDVAYTPYIGFVFVGEEYRGHRLSERMLNCATDYAKKIGFAKVFLVSGERGLYEKYGFVKIDYKKDFWGNDEQIFFKYT